jgi:hypothetical protein
MVTTDVNGQAFDVKAIWSLSPEGNLLVESPTRISMAAVGL